MNDTVSQVVHQLEEHFPVVFIKSGQRSVLIDYAEMLFKPGLVSEVMNLDKIDESARKGPALFRVMKRVSCSIDKLAQYHCRRGSHSS